MNRDCYDTKRAAQELLRKEGTFMVPDKYNLYQYAIENSDNKVLKNVIKLACEFSHKKMKKIVQYKFIKSAYGNHVDEAIIRDIEKEYNNTFTDKIVETHEYISQRITKLDVNVRLKINQMHQAIIQKESENGFIFNVPFHFGEEYVEKLCKWLNIRYRSGLVSYIKMLDTYKQMDYILKHGIKKGTNGKYIGFVHEWDVEQKIKEYMKIRGNKTNKLGNNDENWATRGCNFDKLTRDEIMPEFIDPYGEYLNKDRVFSSKLPYNKRQFVYGFDLDENRYLKCNQFFRLIKNYIDEKLGSFVKEEGYTYDKLLNKFVTMLASQTDMVFPIRFILPKSEMFDLGKHPIQQKLDTLLSSNFLGIIKYKLSDGIRSFTKMIFAFKTDGAFNYESGVFKPYFLIDYRLLKIPIGHLEHKTNATYDELSTINWIGNPIYELKKQFNPTKNRILFIHNHKYREIPDHILHKLQFLDQSELTSIINTRFIKTLKNSFSDQKGGKVIISEKIHYIYKSLYNYKYLTYFEFLYLLYPLIYIIYNQFSGFLTYKTAKYKNIYKLTSIVNNKNIITKEILSKFKINIINKDVLELNNYFPTSIINLKTKSSKLFLYPNIKYYTIDNEKLHQNKLYNYYKIYETTIFQQFKLINLDKKIDLIFFNLNYGIKREFEIENERDNIKLRKKIINFIKLNLRRSGTLLFNIAYINLDETKKIILKLQKLFKSVNLYRPEIQHVFKQSGLVLVCKGFLYNEKSKSSKIIKSKYTITSLEKINRNIHLDKEKFYYDLFYFYNKFMNSRDQMGLIRKMQKFQMVCSYLYGKKMNLKFIIKKDIKFRKMIKENMTGCLKDKIIKFDFAEMKRLYKRGKFINSYDDKLYGYGDIWDKMRVNAEYAKLHNYKSLNKLTKDFVKYQKYKKFKINKDSVKEVWKLFLMYPQIIVYRPWNILESDCFYVITKGCCCDVKIPKCIDKYFIDKLIELMKEMCHQYAFRLYKEVTILKYL